MGFGVTVHFATQLPTSLWIKTGNVLYNPYHTILMIRGQQTQIDPLTQG